jgi:hypothetical protein
VLIRLLQHFANVAKVGLKGSESFSERRQPLTRVLESCWIKIHSEDACLAGRIQNCFTVSAQPNRAINKETATLRSEEPQCLFQQHGAMGRASAPQRRSQHHRPVISFKDLSSFVF